MSDFDMTPEERLRSLDPAAGAAYAHADPAAMLARITATERVARVRWADGFRMRMGTAVAAATLVTAGGIAAMQAAAPSLGVFALGKTTTTASGVGAARAPGADFMRLATNYHFVAGSSLTSGVSSAPTYTLSGPADYAQSSQTVADVFAVSGIPSATPAANSYWTMGDTSAHYVNFWSDSTVLSWEYADGSSNGGVTTSVGSPPVDGLSSGVTTATGISNGHALSLSQDFLSRLGVNNDLGAATYSHSSVDVNGASTVQTTVSIPIDVAGQDTGYSFTFTFDDQGGLVYASGVDVTIAAGPAYPLLSEIAGVAALQTQQDSYQGGPIAYMPPVTATTTAPSGSGAAGASTGSAGAPTTTTPSGTTETTATVPVPPDTTPVTTPDTTPVTTPTTIPTIDVTLDSVTIQYAQYTLADGSEVLLPQYVYSGVVDGYTSTWVILAVDTNYIQLGTGSGGVTPMVQ